MIIHSQQYCITVIRKTYTIHYTEESVAEIYWAEMKASCAFNLINMSAGFQTIRCRVAASSLPQVKEKQRKVMHVTPLAGKMSAWHSIRSVTGHSSVGWMLFLYVKRPRNKEDGAMPNPQMEEWKKYFLIGMELNFVKHKSNMPTPALAPAGRVTLLNFVFIVFNAHLELFVYQWHRQSRGKRHWCDIYSQASYPGGIQAQCLNSQVSYIQPN